MQSSSSSSNAGVIVEPAVIAYNLEVKADVVADIANIAEFNKTSDTQARSVDPFGRDSRSLFLLRREMLSLSIDNHS